MFSDRNAEDVSVPAFPSDWRRTMSLKTGSSQTDPAKPQAKCNSKAFGKGCEK